MKTKLSILLFVVAVFGMASGCSQEGAIGGLAGGAAGTALGAAVGGEDGWWIGGLAGAALGTAAGEIYHSETHKKFCPVGGEEYPNNYQICPLHNVQLHWKH